MFWGVDDFDKDFSICSYRRTEDGAKRLSKLSQAVHLSAPHIIGCHSIFASWQRTNRFPGLSKFQVLIRRPKGYATPHCSYLKCFTLNMRWLYIGPRLLSTWHFVREVQNFEEKRRFCRFLNCWVFSSSDSRSYTDRSRLLNKRYDKCALKKCAQQNRRKKIYPVCRIKWGCISAAK